MTLLRRFLAVTLLLALAAARASTGVSAPEDPLTLAGLYARMQATIARETSLLETTIASTMRIGDQHIEVQERVWFDAHGAARSERTATFGGATRTMTTVVRGDAAYVLEDGARPNKRQAVVCRSAPNPAVSLLLGCRGFVETVTATRIIEDTTYGGVPAVAVETHSTTDGRAGPMRYVDRLYVDADSFLPIAFVSEGIGEDGATTSAAATFSHERVAGDAMLRSLLEPASIGYAASDPTAELRHAGDAYWLGERYEPPALPPLELRSVFVADASAEGVLGPRVALTYGRVDDVFGESVLRVSVVDASAETRNDVVRIMREGRAIEIEAEGEYATPHAIATIVGALRPFR
jgi:hypothetical protein